MRVERVVRALLLLVAMLVSAQGPAAQTPPDISGFWQLSFDGRNVPRAELAAGVTPAMLAEQARKDAHAIRWCNFQGLPAAMDSPRPINIRQGRREVVMSFETVAAPRHIYFRASHPSMDEFDPTTSGDSIARWEGDTLVVDTLGFDGTKGITSIPGGGFRTSQSHLVERFRLIKDGRVLSVTSTWEDAAVFAKPAHLRVPLRPRVGPLRARAAAGLRPIRRRTRGLSVGAPRAAGRREVT